MTGTDFIDYTLQILDGQTSELTYLNPRSVIISVKFGKLNREILGAHTDVNYLRNIIYQ